MTETREGRASVGLEIVHPTQGPSSSRLVPPSEAFVRSAGYAFRRPLPDIERSSSALPLRFLGPLAEPLIRSHNRRRLPAPNLNIGSAGQVNVGRQQINVAGSQAEP